jgi:hypothetical protein
MRHHAGALVVLIALATTSPGRLEAQEAWKILPVEETPARVTGWALAVDSQRVVKTGDGIYSVYLRWTARTGFTDTPPAKAIERHRLDCSARQTRYSDVFVLPMDGQRDLIFAFSDAPETLLTFDNAGSQGAQLESVCRWAKDAVAR